MKKLFETFFVCIGDCGRDGFLEDIQGLGWNGEFVNGVLVSVRCPECQTPEQHLEAAVNEAVVRYA